MATQISKIMMVIENRKSSNAVTNKAGRSGDNSNNNGGNGGEGRTLINSEQIQPSSL